MAIWDFITSPFGAWVWFLPMVLVLALLPSRED